MRCMADRIAQLAARAQARQRLLPCEIGRHALDKLPIGDPEISTSEMLLT